MEKRTIHVGGAVRIAALLLIGQAAAARADDTFRERVADHQDQVEAHRRDKASRELEADLQRTVALFREAEGTPDGTKIQERLIKQVGSLTKLRDDVVRIAALDALGLMGHEDCARYLKPFLKPTKDVRRQKCTLAAIDAAGGVADGALVPPLLRIVDKSKNYAVAAKAVQALGKFGHCKRYRKRVVEELAKTLKRDMPAAPKRGRSTQDAYLPGKNGSAGTARWTALSRVLPGALNELTGQSISNVGDWLAIVREYRRDLGALFQDDDSS